MKALKPVIVLGNAQGYGTVNETFTEYEYDERAGGGRNERNDNKGTKARYCLFVVVFCERWV